MVIRNGEVLFSYGFTFLVIVGLFLLYQVIKCFAYMRAFKLCGHKNYWAAWVPFYNQVVFAECTGQLEANVVFRLPMEIFRFWWVIWYILMLLPMFNFFGFIWSIICRMFCFKWVYIRLRRSAIGWGGVAAFFSCFISIIPIIIFFTAKSDGVWNDNVSSYDNTPNDNNGNDESGDSYITFN